jgi:excisionase family DNA binding protein
MAEHDHHNLGGSNRLLSLEEAAAYLGDIKPRTLRAERQAWGIPSVPVGRQLKFRQRDLDAWIAKRVAA